MIKSQDFTRSKALNNVPSRKVKEKIESIEKENIDFNLKTLKLTAVNRYAEANIPIEYWGLKMEKDFHGASQLMTVYQDVTSDLKQSYINGVSVCFAGTHGTGKQLSLDTELPTPNGFIKLIDLKEGDQLFDENGNICNVTKLHPINLSPESYEIEFDDGTKVEACADHLWSTWDRKSRFKYSKNKDSLFGPQIRNTKEILRTLRVDSNNVANHSIPCAKPLNYSYKELPIDPYVLGAWLGDGHSREGSIECADKQILNEIKKVGYSINLYKSTMGRSKSCKYGLGDKVKNKNHRTTRRLTEELKQLNLLKNKHIPEMYLYSSVEQRLSLLQGLMDTDGCCFKSGGMEYCSVNPDLAFGVLQLINSLGIKAKCAKNKTFLNGKDCKDRYRINFTTTMPVFRLKRKLEKIVKEKAQICRTTHRYIVNIKEIASKPMRCITVDSPSHLFLITRSFIATHNTMTSTSILKKACDKGFNCTYTTLSDAISVLTQADHEERFLARRELCMVDFLTLDELDPRFMSTENSVDLYARTLETIFRTRSQNKLPTFICTNSPNVVESFSGSLKASIDSLMKGYLTVVPVLGEDYRKRNKQ